MPTELSSKSLVWQSRPSINLSLSATLIIISVNTIPFQYTLVNFSTYFPLNKLWTINSPLSFASCYSPYYLYSLLPILFKVYVLTWKLLYQVYSNRPIFTTCDLSLVYAPHLTLSKCYYCLFYLSLYLVFPKINIIQKDYIVHLSAFTSPVTVLGTKNIFQKKVY